LKKSFLEITEESVDKKSRIKRLHDSVFKTGIIDIQKITEIPEKILNTIDQQYEILSLSEVDRKISNDGTVKFLFKLHDGLCIESVLILDDKQRVTMCISSQVGCRMGCTFCKTSIMGLQRNLSAFEIVSQVIYLFHFMKYEKQINTSMFNIVYMGMGEPFDNYENCLSSIQILCDKRYFSLHPSWITVSTCGIIDKAEEILEVFPRLRIAISLHSAINSKRTEIMKITKKFSVPDIKETLQKIYEKYKQRITLEYVLIKNYNDHIEDIDALEIFNHKAFHINIIPLNNEINGYTPPTDSEVKDFRYELTKRGFFATMRIRKGGDIQADCGQLYLETM